jgi:hypothetical protein
MKIGVEYANNRPRSCTCASTMDFRKDDVRAITNVWRRTVAAVSFTASTRCHFPWMWTKHLCFLLARLKWKVHKRICFVPIRKIFDGYGDFQRFCRGKGHTRGKDISGCSGCGNYKMMIEWKLTVLEKACKFFKCVLSNQGSLDEPPSTGWVATSVSFPSFHFPYVKKRFTKKKLEL